VTDARAGPVPVQDAAPTIASGPEALRNSHPPGRRTSARGLDQPRTRVLFCDVTAYPPAANVRLSGELTVDTVGDLGAELAALIRTGHHQLIIDAHPLAHVSPVCVGVLNRATIDLRALGGTLTITGFDTAGEATLREAGLDKSIRFSISHAGQDPPTGEQIKGAFDR
jgi:anti-anti-sigma regulatory factor